jgi:hypothetical protein
LKGDHESSIDFDRAVDRRGRAGRRVGLCPTDDRPLVPGEGAYSDVDGLPFVGGLILGPPVQLEAFGALWTGWPFGADLTDNKTLIAVLAWVPAVVAALRNKKTRLSDVARDPRLMENLPGKRPAKN